MSVMQERGKNKVRRRVFLALHHSVPLICTQGLLGTARHLCQGTWTHSVSGIVLPTTTPPLSPEELISPYSGSTRLFPPVLLLMGPAVLEKAKKPGCWFEVTSNSDSVQDEGSPAHRQAVDAHAGPGCLWEWEVKHPGFVSSGGPWHGSPSLPSLHYVPFYLFAFARLHRLCWAKNVQIMLCFL